MKQRVKGTYFFVVLEPSLMGLFWLLCNWLFMLQNSPPVGLIHGAWKLYRKPKHQKSTQMTDDRPVKAQGSPARMQGGAPLLAAMPAWAIPSRSPSCEAPSLCLHKVLWG